MKKLLISLGFLLSLAGAAVAQPMCLPYELLVKQLGDEFGETQMFIGMVPAASGQVELFVNMQNETWTIIVRPEPQVGCFASNGEGFKLMVPQKIEQKKGGGA